MNTEGGPQARYQELVAELLATSAAQISDGKGFGRNSLTIGRKIFATLHNGRLMLKLPRGRVASLIMDGRGEPLEMGRGRIMKEWVLLREEQACKWHALAEEAMAFVEAETKEARSR